MRGGGRDDRTIYVASKQATPFSPPPKKKKRVREREREGEREREREREFEKLSF